MAGDNHPPCFRNRGNVEVPTQSDLEPLNLTVASCLMPILHFDVSRILEAWKFLSESVLEP